MNDDQPPTGIRRMYVRALAYARIGVWMAKEMNPWRRPYGKRR
ncbi:hypothetical protein [Methylobacterium iners]|uniref:Uncharacterized protein n=1 Tax=Methylobacterium iners TaxID=418707 RepID=A0ABQ4S407_9HYPH|nr:hypothetical protein [Methylobacterium iners]GJD97824.1 hypothetical protein OCOJLMKI_5063 [Methylobacterium iners]